MSKELKHEISNFYMIGDNPTSDIRGGNLADWKTILVKSGVYQGNSLPKSDSPTHIVDDFEKAIDLIFHEEGLSVEWNN